MQEWVINFINHFGYFAIALLIAIENIFPPIPSELILTFSGFMTTYTGMKIWLVIVFATIGSVSGAIILYGVGRLLSPKRLEGIINKWGHILGLKKEDVQRAESWFLRRGSSTVFFCRFIPLIRSLISIPAGMSNMRKDRFFFYTIIGTAIWNTVLVYLGALAGAGWEHIVNYMNVYSYIALVILGVLGVVFVIWVLNKKKSGDKMQSTTETSENKTDESETNE